MLEVRGSDGRTVKYASPSEMLRIAAELEGLLTTATFQRTTFTSFVRE